MVTATWVAADADIIMAGAEAVAIITAGAAVTIAVIGTTEATDTRSPSSSPDE